MASTSEELFLEAWREYGKYELVSEYRFYEKRRWRFDFAHVASMVAIEIEGGVWSGGRHTRPHGYTQDAEKYNAATCAGWAVLRYTSEMLNTLPEVCVEQANNLIKMRLEREDVKKRSKG